MGLAIMARHATTAVCARARPGVSVPLAAGPRGVVPPQALAPDRKPQHHVDELWRFINAVQPSYHVHAYSDLVNVVKSRADT